MAKYLDSVGLAELTGNIKTDLNTKANINGSYETLTAGVAKNLESPDGVSISSVFSRRQSGGTSSISDGIATIDNIYGFSIIWNQLVNTNTTSVTTISGHIYYTNIGGVESIVTGVGQALSVTGGTDMVIDLTRMYKACPSLIPTTVDAFRSLYQEAYYSYNSGTIYNVNPISITANGFNQYNGSYAKVLRNVVYYINGGYTGVSFSKTLIGSTSYVTVTNRLFTAPDNGYVFIDGADGNTCVNISWTGTKNGTFKTYTQHALAINPVLTTNFTYGLARINSVYDERNYSTRKDVQRIGCIKLKNLVWSYVQSSGCFLASAPGDMKKVSASTIANLFCLTYTAASYNTTLTTDKTICNSVTNNNVYIHDSRYTNASSLVSSFGEEVLYYELTTAVSTDISTTVSNIIQEEDYGTEEWVYDLEDSIAVPVYCQLTYLQNLVDKLRTDVVTISAQTLNSAQSEQVRDNIDAGEISCETIGTTTSALGVDASSLQGHNSSYFQEKLYNGTNIKSINGFSLLGSGNLVIGGSGSGTGTNVIWNQITANGTKIAEISIDGSATNVLVPNYSGSVTSVNGYTGVVVLDKSDVGLANVDNTNDLSKPVSTATQNALATKYEKPSTGIPYSDFSEEVQLSLDKADSAIQTHQDISGKTNLTTFNAHATNSNIHHTINVTSNHVHKIHDYDIAAKYDINNAAINTTYETINNVNVIRAKIPDAATAANQLADKNFVNSSISTQTGHYISNNGEPFTSLAQLQAYSGTVYSNDYATVTGTDSGTTYYDRYKASYTNGVLSWNKEYRLNNSSFTSVQWDAINSTITSNIVTNITSHISNTSNPHGVTKSQVGLENVDNTSDLDKPVSNATQNAISNAVPTKTSQLQNDGNGTNPFLTTHQDISTLTAHVSDSTIHVTSSNKTTWNAKYTKPSGGIPLSDLSSEVSNTLQHPIGYIFEWSNIKSDGTTISGAPDLTTPAKVADYFGYGTWELFSSGRFSVTINTSDTSFNSIGKTGGSKDAITVNHTHSTVNHTHGLNGHTHTLGGHTHPGGLHSHTMSTSHTHAVSHTHSFNVSGNGTTNSDGEHCHSFIDYQTYVKAGATGAVEYVGNQSHELTTFNAGTHNHTFNYAISGTTGAVSNGTTSSNSAGTATGSNSATTGAASGSTGSNSTNVTSNAVSVNYAGSDATNANLPPYIVVYKYIRVA